MSQQSGGDGYGKVRKSCQTGGASGWAKHCGSTKDHQMSNRIERRLGKQELDDGRAPRMRGSRRDKVPTRRHLLMRLEHINLEIERDRKSREQHRKLHPGCKCMTCSDKWFSTWRKDSKAKIMKEFEKYGYEIPEAKP